MSGECLSCGEHCLDCKCHKNTEIRDSLLPKRAKNILMKQGFRYINELSSISAKDMTRWVGFGQKTLNSIRYLLSQEGLALKEELPKPEKQMSLYRETQEIIEIVKEIKYKTADFIGDLRRYYTKLDKIIRSLEEKTYYP